MCSGFDSLLCSERFFSGYSGFPFPQKPTFPNSNSILECTDISERVLKLLDAPWVNTFIYFSRKSKRNCPSLSLTHAQWKVIHVSTWRNLTRNKMFRRAELNSFSPRVSYISLDCTILLHSYIFTIRFARLLIKCSIVEPERQYNPGDGINKRYDLAFHY